jgi:rRNA maturation endonuclease Nob1
LVLLAKQRWRRVAKKRARLFGGRKGGPVKKKRKKKGDWVQCATCKTEWKYNGKDICPICYRKDVLPVKEE